MDWNLKSIRTPMRKKRGFTLVELAISLVVIGLLVGGVLAGRELLHTAELRAVVTEIKEYKVAVDNFVTQYEGLPGDMDNATDFFGSGATANGDGDQKIEVNEYFTAWDQLALAKMVPGFYSGTGSEADIGTNVPPVVNLAAAGYSLAWQASPGPTDGAGVDGWRDRLNRYFSYNYILMAGEKSSSKLLQDSVLSGGDAYFIDSKIDDGQPDFGKVLAQNGDGESGCTSVTDPKSDGEYSFSSSTKTCRMYFAIE
jgi:prepilin-type N-terminal cleavage/methylation domain-containing protein